MAKREVHQTLCRMCDDHCGINVYVEDGKVVDIDGNKDHVWNKGRLCIKGRAGVDLNNAPDRIRKPLKKTENGWEEISLEQALDEIAAKTKEIQSKYGKRTMSVWKGEAIGFAQQEENYRRFIHAIGSPNYFSNDSECFVGRWIGYSLVYGRWGSQPEFINSKCIVTWGANPPHAHPNMTQQINHARDNGAKLIVIDSRLSAIGRQADIFVQVKPGTDGALAWGVMRELIENNWYDKEFVEKFTLGFDKVKEYASKFTPEYVAKETGIEASLVKEVAKAMWDNAPAVINYVGNGLEHHENGINNIRAVAYFDGLLGSVDAKGGNFLPSGFPLKELTLYHDVPLIEEQPIGRDRFPVLYDFRQECHTMVAMDTILSEDPYPLKGMIIAGANPVMTNPNANKVTEALKSLELLVVRELFMSETAELADYILPAASYLERSELHGHGGFQVIGLTKKVVEPEEGIQDEYQFLHDLAHRLGAGDYFPWENEYELNKWLVSDSGVKLEEIEAHPEGYNYAEKTYHKHEQKVADGEKAFNTPSGKLEFASEYLKNLGYQEIAEYIPPTYVTDKSEEYPYVLITGARKVMYYHGRNRNFARLKSAMPTPEIELHPVDAKKLDVVDDDIVKVTSTIGSIEIPVKVMHKKEIGEGVVQITHGWKESNVNILTHDDRFDPIDGFPLMKSVEVKIEKVNK
ncbi:molybdopterin-containing oxidoreductase family protein [Tepidibacter hydrothermalis]|uniref:Molybdopterin-dependent oxidoreductase n=1 Tax=Tepidibacter hydrothermalis TaxID=3036126 RepID=A0ABY8EGL5_9FIRM|nr:molybdopterin-dependent oxidoreductase [Tepidibacter hydrothermalis]WFD10617.1 molybdopterin-dependent oxidoreductase [Tepidibacter hydrothermalis]